MEIINRLSKLIRAFKRNRDFKKKFKAVKI